MGLALVFDYVNCQRIKGVTPFNFFLKLKPKKADVKDSVACPNCGRNNWIETDTINEGKI
jgi:hypothetical protein